MCKRENEFIVIIRRVIRLRNEDNFLNVFISFISHNLIEMKWRHKIAKYKNNDFYCYLSKKFKTFYQSLKQISLKMNRSFICPFGKLNAFVSQNKTFHYSQHKDLSSSAAGSYAFNMSFNIAQTKAT